MGWIIAAAIVLFFVLLLAGRVAVFFDYNGKFALKIKYMCFTVVKLPKKKKPKKVKKKRAKKGKKSKSAKDGKKDGKPEDKKKKGGKKKSKFSLKSLTFDDILALLKQALTGVGKPLKKLFKRIEFSHMSIGIVCGGDDAAKTAIKFGAVNIAVGNALGLLDSFFTLKPLDDLNIGVDFQSEKTLYDCYFEVRLTLFAAIVAGFRIIKAALKLYKSYKKAQGKNKS